MNHQSKHLPPGWSRTRIGDFTAEKITQIKPAPPFDYIDISSINNTSKTIESPKKLTSFDTVPSRARQQLQSDDILVSMTRPNLNAVAQVPAEFNGSIASTGFHVLRPLSVSPDWLFAYVRSKDFIDSLVAHVQGALYPAIRPDDIRSHEIALPPLPEQRRIVAKIESLQERSSRARAALAEVGPLLEQFRRSVLSAAFSGRLTADWRAANPDIEPASELLNRIRTDRRQRWEQAELAKYEAKGKKPPKTWQEKYPASPAVVESPLPQLPAGWCSARFDELIDELRNGVSPKPQEQPPGVPVLRINSVRPRSVNLEEVRYLPNRDNMLEIYRIRNGDLLFTRYNGSIDLLGVCGMVRGLHDQSMLYPDKLMRVRLAQQYVLPEFIELFFSSPVARKRVTAKAKTTSGQQGVSGSDIKGQSVALAPLAEQREIIDRVSALFKAIEATAALVASASLSLNQLDQSILAKAFRGELVPQDPADEPASELLARIAAARDAAASSSKTTKRARKPAARKAANP